MIRCCGDTKFKMCERRGDRRKKIKNNKKKIIWTGRTKPKTIKNNNLVRKKRTKNNKKKKNLEFRIQIFKTIF